MPVSGPHSGTPSRSTAAFSDIVNLGPQDQVALVTHCRALGWGSSSSSHAVTWQHEVFVRAGGLTVLIPARISGENEQRRSNQREYEHVIFTTIAITFSVPFAPCLPHALRSGRH